MTRQKLTVPTRLAESVNVRQLIFVIGILSIVAVARPNTAQAAGSDVQKACPAGNLLTRARLLSGNIDLGSRSQLLVDGIIAPDGMVWPSRAVLVTLQRQSLVYDLGAVFSLHSMFIQADADQAVGIDLSKDGVAWQRLDIPAHPTAAGMLSRHLRLSGVDAEFLRVKSPDPIAPLALTELGAFCDENALQSTPLKVAGALPDTEVVGWFGRHWLRLTGSPAVTVTQGYLIKLLIVIGTCLIVWQCLRLRGQRRTTDALLVTMALLSSMAYSNFGAYHYPEFMHTHDVFHYFVGSKYFRELRYNDLYQCAGVAEAESGFAQRLKLRAQRDLHTDRFVTGEQVLRGAVACRERFSSSRWESFKDDVAYFANRSGIEGWHRILKDHGFNGSPAWIALGSSLVGELPARPWSIGEGNSMLPSLIGPLDPILLLLALGTVVWAFGWRTACFVVILFGCNPLSQFQWVGGGFLRQAWLSSLVVGLCLLHKQRWLSAGIALGCATLLQLIPAFALLGIGLLIAKRSISKGMLDCAGCRVLLGSVVALALGIPLSIWGCGSAQAWGSFLANTVKHDATISANLVGLPTALSFRMATRGAALFDASQVDPFSVVRAARATTLAAMRPVQWALAAVGVLSVWRVLRNVSFVAAACFGLIMVTLVVDESCYYLAWLACLGLLWSERRSSVFPVLALLAGTLGILLVVEGADVPYAISSWWMLACFATFLALFGRKATASIATAQQSVTTK
jgi:hypothetical protein